MRGRKPKPTVTHIANGNPSKRPLPQDEPQPSLTAADKKPPAFLKGEARKEWKRVVNELCALGLFTSFDRGALASWCSAWKRLVEAEKWMEEHGTTYVMRDKDGRTKSVVKCPQVTIAETASEQLRKLASEFGFSPASRPRLGVRPKNKREAMANEGAAGGNVADFAAAKGRK